MVALTTALSSGSAFAETLVFDQPETAGISGFRAMWDTPVVTAADGVRMIRDSVIQDRGGTAPWAAVMRQPRESSGPPSRRQQAQEAPEPLRPGALAFDAIHRRLLIRFPGAAEKIAEQVRRGLGIENVELLLPFADTELWPEGDSSWAPPEGGYVYRMNWGVDQMYRKARPTWHAVAWALRKPWAADPQLGPTDNAYIDGVGYWARFGAQDREHDRFPKRFGPTPVDYEKPQGRMDVTAALTDEAFGKTLGGRLRRLSDCGFLVRKWETYDHRYYNGAYEWGTSTGGRAIVVDTPKLIVTLGRSGERPRLGPLPDPANIEALAEQLRQSGRGGRPTAVMPSREQLKQLAERFSTRRPDWMPDWQWQRTKELMEVAYGKGATEKPFWYQFVPDYIKGRYTQRFGPGNDGWEFEGHDPQRVYEAWVDQMLGKQFRGWYGFEASAVLLPWFAYREAMPAPVQQWFRDYWTAWLMPERPTASPEKHKDFTYAEGPLIHPMADDSRVGGPQANNPDPAAGRYDTYFAKTGDWQGNKSFYRSGFNYTISTTNFNNTASMGALLGGAIIGSPYAVADGRHGQMNFPLRLWTWYDGSSQEDIDHYYFAITLTAQKMIADFGPEHFDRMIGQSMLTKSINLLADAYHPGLRRFIAGSSRTATEHLLVTQDGLYHVLHTLSRRGVLRDLDNSQIAHDLPVIGHDLPPEQVARQTVVSPWAPEWVGRMIDEKPLPYQVTSAYKMWGGHDQRPLMRRHYLGRHYGLYSVNAQTGNVPILAHFKRGGGDVRRMQEVVTMLMRFGINTTRLVNDAGGWINTYGNQATLQHGGKMIVATSPWSYGNSINEKREIKSIQSTIALYNFEQPRPSWEIYIDGRRVEQLPAVARASQRITIRDGVSYLGVIPLPATNLGRQDEVLLRAGRPQTYYNRYTVRAALCIDNLNRQRNDPLPKDSDWDAIDKAYGGFVVELADATEYRSFQDFQRHVAEARLSTTFNTTESLHEIAYQSGEDAMKLGVYTTYREGETLDKLFAHQTVNDRWPYLPEGIDRDSPLVQQGTVGRLEKNGAVLRTEPGRMAMLITEPRSQTSAACNVLAEPTWFDFTAAGGQRLVADGRLGLCRVVFQPGQNRLTIDHGLTQQQAKRTDVATALLGFGLKESVKIILNGEPVRPAGTARIDGQQALVVPLTSGPLQGRYPHAEEMLRRAEAERAGETDDR